MFKTIKKLFSKRKAISPLIATILLIVVAVVLVVIILNWGKIFTSSSLDKTDAISLSKSDATYYTHPISLENGVLHLSYDPPGNSNLDNIVIDGYSVVSKKGQSEFISLSPSQPLNIGNNTLVLSDFNSLEIPHFEKITLILKSGNSSITFSVVNKNPSITECAVCDVCEDCPECPECEECNEETCAEMIDTSCGNLPYIKIGTGTFKTKLCIQPNQNTSVFTWANAINYCENLDQNGFSDWRLPSLSEFLMIMDPGFVADTGWSDKDISINFVNENIIDNGSNFDLFKHNVYYYYWTSTSYTSSTAYFMYLSNGYIYNNNKTTSKYVRCVRDPI